jgi:hypothetical protein
MADHFDDVRFMDPKRVDYSRQLLPRPITRQSVQHDRDGKPAGSHRRRLRRRQYDSFRERGAFAMRA